MSAGTGGTIAGISQYLKSKNNNINIVLADPQGSSLHNRVKYKVCYTTQQQERTLKRHRYESIVEGVGLDRITENFNKAVIDNSEKVNIHLFYLFIYFFKEIYDFINHFNLLLLIKNKK
jgi:cysteine synthase A